MAEIVRERASRLFDDLDDTALPSPPPRRVQSRHVHSRVYDTYTSKATPPVLTSIIGIDAPAGTFNFTITNSRSSKVVSSHRPDQVQREEQGGQQAVMESILMY